MTRTSGSCLPADGRAGLQRPGRGFSLLELLVVLALGAMLVALVVPRLNATVAAVQTSGERSDVVRRLGGMAVSARLKGTAVSVEAGQELPLDLPEGWEVRALGPLAISALGVCTQADITVVGPTGPEQWRVNAPDCHVTD